jgi:monomeric isocitrate dehydrogenase
VEVYLKLVLVDSYVEQFTHEGYLRWDSLESFSFQVSLEHLGSVYNNPKALVLAEALDRTDKFFKTINLQLVELDK